MKAKPSNMATGIKTLLYLMGIALVVIAMIAIFPVVVVVVILFGKLAAILIGIAFVVWLIGTCVNRFKTKPHKQ